MYTGVAPLQHTGPMLCLRACHAARRERASTIQPNLKSIGDRAMYEVPNDQTGTYAACTVGNATLCFAAICLPACKPGGADLPRHRVREMLRVYDGREGLQLTCHCDRGAFGLDEARLATPHHLLGLRALLLAHNVQIRVNEERIQDLRARGQSECWGTLQN